MRASLPLRTYLARLILPALMVAAMVTLWHWQPLNAQEGVIHIVAPGDTLSEIAAAYDTDVATLRRVNGITGNLIRIGQRLLVVDPGRESDALGEVEPDTSSQSQPGLITHVVRQGDQLGRIAAHYGTTVAALVQLNNIENARLIVPGQTLLIPAAAGDPPASITQSWLPEGLTANEKWIEVDLSTQRVIAHEGTRLVRTFRVSTGLPDSPTVAGQFRIRVKVAIQDMSGGNRASSDTYYLKDVQWVQYFFEDYAFHGTYWHANFGRPASRGCINMSNSDAEWLFNWSGPDYTEDGPLWQWAIGSNPGTFVLIHE